jgi:AhpD family alkylhydroperoxidase
MTVDRELRMSLLSSKTEALLDVGIAATVGCDSCIDKHIQDALAAGAQMPEVRQTIDLARQIGGKTSFDCCEEADHYMGTLDEAS